MPIKKIYFDEANKVAFRDPVHGDIYLYPYEIKIINTYSFQRLRGIKQLGTCHLVWMGASHNRFQHSIGTLHISWKILNSIADRGDIWSLIPSRLVVSRLFALLHDIGHIPFGHCIEDERPILMERHSDPERVNRVLRGDIEEIISDIENGMSKDDKENCGLIDKTLKELLVELITETKGETDLGEQKALDNNIEFFRDLVGNTVCADLLDYLRRDAYYAGLRRDYDERILENMVLTQDGRMGLNIIDQDAMQQGIVTEIMHLMRVRYTLASRVYFNPTNRCAAAMVSKAIELAGINIEDLCELTDDGLLDIIKSGSVDKLRERETKRNEDFEFMILTEAKRTLKLPDELLSFYKKAGKKDDHITSDDNASKLLAIALRERNLFRPIYTATFSERETDPQEFLEKWFFNKEHINVRRKMEDALAEYAGLDGWQVIIHCPKLDMNMKFVNPLVGPFGPDKIYYPLEKTPESADIRLETLKNEARSIRSSHRELWSFNVLVPENLEDGIISKLNDISCKIFKLKDSSHYSEYGSMYSFDRSRREHASAAIQDLIGRSPTIDEVSMISGLRGFKTEIPVSKGEYLELLLNTDEGKQMIEEMKKSKFNKTQE